MVLFSMKYLALKWSYLFFGSGLIVLIEYFNLYMKQLGFSPSQIGFTTRFGVIKFRLSTRFRLDFEPGNSFLQFRQRWFF